MKIKTVSVNLKVRDQMESDLIESLRHTGFAVITDHGIPPHVFEQMYDVWKAFFSHPTWKNRFKFDEKTQWGYFPFKSEKAKAAKLEDLKEFFHFFGNNEEQVLPSLPLALSKYTFDAFSELEELALVLLRIIEKNTPDEVKQCKNWSSEVQGSPNTLLRVLHYPPVDGSTGAVRSAAHEDINFITLLPAATQPGLQVMDLSGNWNDVSVVDPASILMNVGDMLQEATAGYYKSTTHRVVNPPDSANVSRLSLPLFLHPHPDTRLSDRYTAGAYLDERLSELGLVKSKEAL